MRYTKLDLLLAGFALFQFLATLLWAVSDTSTGLNIVLVILFSLLFYFNPIVVTHNFLHCPFFKSDRANSLFAIFNSANLTLPQVLYKHHHLIHHRYNNDQWQQSCENGNTMDPSSTFRFGKNGKHEGMVKYSGLSLFRDGTTYSLRRTIEKKETTQLVLETISVLLAVSLWIYIDWQWFLFCYLPVFYFGWFLAHMENYYEHFRASEPGNRYANSVSYYGKIYNKIMFNEGYHQEHHIQPGRHWKDRPSTQIAYAEKMADAKAYIAKYPPLLGFLD